VEPREQNLSPQGREAFVLRDGLGCEYMWLAISVTRAQPQLSFSLGGTLNG